MLDLKCSHSAQPRLVSKYTGSVLPGAAPPQGVIALPYALDSFELLKQATSKEVGPQDDLKSYVAN